MQVCYCFLLAYVIKKVPKDEQTQDVEKKENKVAADVSKGESVREEEEKAEKEHLSADASHSDMHNGLHSAAAADSDVFEEVETVKNDEAKVFSADKVEAAKHDGKERGETSGSDTEVVHVPAEKVDEVEHVVEDKLPEKIEETKPAESSEFHSQNHKAFDDVTADHVPSSAVLEAKHGNGYQPL